MKRPASPAPPASQAAVLVLRNRQKARSVNLASLRSLILGLLRGPLGLDRFELCLHLVDADEIAALNWRYLRHQGSTDVISFDHAASGIPFSDGHRAGAPPGSSLHGEIFISLDDAVAAAKRFGVSWQSELARYVIHGLLHLRGYDDRDPASRRAMKREENRLLRLASTQSALAGLSKSRPPASPPGAA